MNEHKRLTPTSRWRERLLRLANDTRWGEHLAYWVGKVAGGLQLRLEKLRPSNAIPWRRQVYLPIFDWTEESQAFLQGLAQALEVSS